MPVRLNLYLVKLVLILAAVSASAAEKDKDSQDKLFKANDIFELEFAADPQLSPDASKVVYVRSSKDIMTDSTRANLWSIGVDGKNHRPILSGRKNYSSPRWSPSADRLAFISAAEGSPQGLGRNVRRS